MNKMCLFITAFFACSSLFIQAQEQDFTPDPTYTDGKRHKEFMLNMTPLVSQFVPFNASNLSNLNLFDYQYRKLKNGKGFRWGLGISTTDQSDNPAFFYLRVGRTKLKQLSKHFHVSRSFDFNILADDIDGSGRRGRSNFNGIALSYSVGIEYSFTRNIALSTEGTLLFGLGGNDDFGGRIQFLPPVGLFFHVKL